MTPTRHYTTVSVTLTLPRPMRQIAARLTDRLAHKGNGMSQHAIEAVQALLAPSDLVTLTYLQMIAVQSQGYAESARIELARSRGKLTARHIETENALTALNEQIRQQITGPVDLEDIRLHQAKASGPGQVRMGELGRHRKPEKLDIFPAS